MASNKQEEVIESIKKLITYGISDSEIIENLREVGIDETSAKELINLAKSKPQVLEKKVIVDDSEGLSFKDQILSQAKITSDEEPTKKDKTDDIDDSVKSEEIDFGEEENQNSISKSNDDFKNDSGKINIKDRLDKLINKKENNSSQKIELNNESDDDSNDSSKNSENKSSLDFKKELERELRDLEKSRSALVQPKNTFSNFENRLNTTEKIKSISDPEIEQMWKKGIIVAINSKLNEMKKLKDDVDALVENKVNDAVKKETKQFRVLLESQRDLIMSSNKEVLDQKQKEITFIIDSKISEVKKQAKELSGYVEAIQKSKEDEEKIFMELQKTLNEAKSTKSQLIIEMNSELIKSKSKAQEFIDTAQDQINEMDQRINKTLELEKNIAEGLVEEAEQKIERMTLQKAEDLISEIEIKLNRLSVIEKEINPSEIQTKISLLEQFKKEFLRSMEENITRLNDAIEQINIKNSDVQRELDEKTLAIDAKLEELTKFEKTFTEKLEKILDLDEQKSKPTTKKK